MTERLNLTTSAKIVQVDCHLARDGDISTLSGKSLKLVDLFIYLTAIDFIY